MYENGGIVFQEVKTNEFICFFFFFFNDTATTEIYTLSLHDALPIYFFVNTFKACIDYLDQADVVVAIADGADADSGTC